MYFLIFPDIVITIGANRTLVLDTKKSGSFNFIPRLPKDLLSLFRRTTIEGIYQLYTGEELHMVKEFVNFIVDNKLGVFVQEISNYPSITNVYYSPSVVEIMVIDIVKKEHKYSFIASQLQYLSCQHLQLRFFSPVSIVEINKVLSPFLTYPWLSIEIIVSNPTWKNHQDIIDLLYKLPMVSVIVFNQDITKLFEVKSKYRNQSISSVLYTQQKFTSPEDCGVIRQDTLYSMSTLQSVIMAKKYNSCLYKKVFITGDGYIANCPCLPYTYGNIDEQDLDLKKIILSTSFQRIWNLKKDDIYVCHDCEFRYICNDCRAFIENILDKPCKCTYNPYTSKWHDL